MKNELIVFDTTLRDGEQSPGCRMNPSSKLLIAEQLERLGVNIIEAGFPIASHDEERAVSQISQKIKKSTICALSRTREEDINSAARSLEKSAISPRIHTFVATSDVHIEKKLRRSPNEILDMIRRSVSLAKKYVDDVQFSPEDAARTGRDFLTKAVKVAIENGATTVNIPDTVGYAVAREQYELIKYLMDIFTNTILSIHCHNDLSCAVSNTLAGIEAGARQFECCVLGIGERAGNAQLESVVMALKTRADYYNINVGLNCKEIGKTARLVSSIIGKPIPDNLPIVGGNAFAHGGGIHKDGVLKDRKTYEIMTPEDVGWKGDSNPLTKHSGRHSLKIKLENIGYEVEQDILEVIYEKFIDLADVKVFVYDDDLHLLLQEAFVERKAKQESLIIIEKINYACFGENISAEITVSQNGNRFTAKGRGDGSVASIWDAILNALRKNNIFNSEPTLEYFNIGKSTGGIEAIGLVDIKIENNNSVAYGRGSDTDILLAFAKAAVAAINHLLETPIKV